jgi:DNA-binding NtrC family response regulator
VAGNEEQIFRARIVSATQRPIIEGQIEGMRADLYYRLAGITVVLPPLRARMDDLAPLAEHFSERLAQPGAAPKRFSARALGALHSYDWPGNLRELEGVVRAALRVSKGTRVGTKEVRAALRRHTKLAQRESSQPSPQSRLAVQPADVDSSLPTVERALIIDAFEAAKHNISEAARQLGIPRSTMRDRLRRLGMI